MSLFERKTRTVDEPGEELGGRPTSEPGEKSMTTKSGGEINALLGRGSEFEGKLTFEGTVRIDGRFTGEIKSSDTLIIGEGAVVEAEITVNTVIVYGYVRGNIRAVTQVQLHSPAKFYGALETKSLVVDQGVIFEGSCHMEDIDKPRSSYPPSSMGPDVEV